MITQEISTEESIARILSTPLGTRVMQPEYGSRLFELVDKSVDDEWVLLAVDYTSEAIETNEPRVSLKNVSVKTGDVAEIAIAYTENNIEKEVYYATA